MVIPELGSIVQVLFGKGLAASTLRSYSAAHKRYLCFCAQFNISPEFPLAENVLCYFVSTLSDDSLKHQTIKCYFSGIRHAQIAMGYGDPFAGQPMPRLEYVLKGIKRSQAEKNAQSKPRLPISQSICCRECLRYGRTPKTQTQVCWWPPAA